MAEVSWRVGNGAGRFRVLKSRGNHAFSAPEDKQPKGWVLTVSLLNGRMVCTTAQEKDGHARGDSCKCRLYLHGRVTHESLGAFVNCKGDVGLNLFANNVFSKPAKDTVSSSGEFSPAFSSISNRESLSVEVSSNRSPLAHKIQYIFGSESSNGRILCNCHNIFELSENSETLFWCGNQELPMTEAQMPRKYPCIRLPDTSSQLNALGHRLSCWKKNGFQIATIPDKSNHQQQRRFCTVLKLSEKQQNLWVQPGFSWFVPFSRAYSWKSKNSSKSPPLYRSKTAYYDILKVSPSATQAQIKTAYYKQSFIFHPDKNPGNEEATQRFSEISEAYTVLGSIALRRKYDRGILNQADVQGAGRPSSKEPRSTSSSTAQQQKRPRHSQSGVGGKPIFDFDAFYQAHYGEQLQRERELRWRREKLREKQQEELKRWKMGKMTEITVAMMLALAAFIFAHLK